LISLLGIFLFQNCTPPSYVFQNPRQTGVDFSTGDWLINVNGIPAIQEKLKSLVKNDFSTKLGTRAVFPEEELATQMLGPMNLSHPNNSQIIEITKFYKYNYLVNISGTVERDLGAFQKSNPQLDSGAKFNSSSVSIEIYDLRNGKSIYFQKVNATTYLPRSNNDFYVSRSPEVLVSQAYKKLFKDLVKSSAFSK